LWPRGYICSISQKIEIMVTWADNQYITTTDLSFKGVLRDVKKSRSALQPIYEAFTNALEAIKLQPSSGSSKGKISIVIRAVETTAGSPEFDQLTIGDTGIGFNDVEFKRFNTYKDFTKGFSNLGSGRIQYVQHFNRTRVTSLYQKDGKYWKRLFVISKDEEFLKNEALVKHIANAHSTSSGVGSQVTFEGLLEKSNLYNQLTASELKNSLLERYMHQFCYNKDALPEIVLQYYLQGELKETVTISDSDIPAVDKHGTFTATYSKLSDDARSVLATENKEIFSVDVFKLPQNQLSKNRIKFISKGEVVENSDLSLNSISETDTVEGNRFIFLVGGDYVEQRDTNVRGELLIPSREAFKKNSAFQNEEILLDDIQIGVDTEISTLYPQLEVLKKKHADDLNSLKDMFLLSDEAIQNVKISPNDSDAKVLTKIYEFEAQKRANVDAEIKMAFEKLTKLSPNSKTYQEDLEKEVKQLAKMIPQQNKNALVHHVARRKLLLDLFGKVINNEIDALKATDDVEKKKIQREAMVHNLLFTQGSDDPGTSDLWIVNEEFIYFKGHSEAELCDAVYNGSRLFKDEFKEEEERYLKSLGENRLTKRPDILLFPEEGKCIIVELKSTAVNASDHLHQIDKYAGLIRNYTVDDVQITTFYGYLLGEKIESRDVQGAVSAYQHSYQFDYLYRPGTPVIGFDGRADGSIYSEVLRYSTLLERAQQRNRAFIGKIGANSKA